MLPDSQPGPRGQSARCQRHRWRWAPARTLLPSFSDSLAISKAPNARSSLGPALTKLASWLRRKISAAPRPDATDVHREGVVLQVLVQEKRRQLRTVSADCAFAVTENLRLRHEDGL